MTDTGDLRERLIRLRDSSFRTDTGRVFKLSEDERDLLAESVNELQRLEAERDSWRTAYRGASCNIEDDPERGE